MSNTGLTTRTQTAEGAGGGANAVGQAAQGAKEDAAESPGHAGTRSRLPPLADLLAGSHGTASAACLDAVAACLGPSPFLFSPLFSAHRMLHASTLPVFRAPARWDNIMPPNHAAGMLAFLSTASPCWEARIDIASRCTQLKFRAAQDMDSYLVTLVTDSSLCFAARRGHLAALTYLDMDGCGKVTDVGLRAVARGCPQLSVLVLAGLDKVTDAGVQAVAQHCQRLREIWLYGNENVTDAAVVALARGCPQLQLVNLRGCHRVTDTGVQALAVGCGLLHTLCISGCISVTDVGLCALAKGCPLLRDGSVWFCQYSRVGKDALLTACPKLKGIGFFCNEWDDGSDEADEDEDEDEDEYAGSWWEGDESYDDADESWDDNDAHESWDDDNEEGV